VLPPNSAHGGIFRTLSHSNAYSGSTFLNGSSMLIYRETIYSLADRYRLPTIYAFLLYVAEGSLMSYGIVSAHMFRGAATYVDRILRGAKPADLPVQLPTKFELVIT
jgi:putative ABC transport system substrate-binding protein